MSDWIPSWNYEREVGAEANMYIWIHRSLMEASNEMICYTIPLLHPYTYDRSMVGILKPSLIL